MPDNYGDQMAPRDTAIEQDFMELKEISSAIDELILRRYKVIDRIEQKHAQNNEQIQSNKDWYEGQVRCNQVPDRNYASEEPTVQRGRY